MKIEISEYDDLIIVRPTNNIRLKTLSALRDVLDKQENNSKFKIAMDMSEVKFIDSSGLSALLHYEQIFKRHNGFICLYNFNPDVKELFDLIEANDFIKIFSDFEEMKNWLCELEEDHVVENT